MSDFITTYDGRAEIEARKMAALRRPKVAPVSEVTPPVAGATEGSIREEMERRLARRLVKPGV